MKMRAAEEGIVFWKKLRSSTFMARFTGGANMSVEDMNGCFMVVLRACGSWRYKFQMTQIECRVQLINAWERGRD